MRLFAGGAEPIELQNSHGLALAVRCFDPPLADHPGRSLSSSERAPSRKRPAVSVRQFVDAEWRTNRTLRLWALAEPPDAFAGRSGV